MIITDNEAASVEGALNKLGLDVKVTRQTHWEIGTNGDADTILKKIDDSGELYNSNKEYISEMDGGENTISFLVRQKEDVLSRATFEALKERFEIEGLCYLKRGVRWNLTVNGGNIDTVSQDILNTHILFNPLSHECYEIN